MARPQPLLSRRPFGKGQGDVSVGFRAYNRGFVSHVYEPLAFPMTGVILFFEKLVLMTFDDP